MSAKNIKMTRNKNYQLGYLQGIVDFLAYIHNYGNGFETLGSSYSDFEAKANSLTEEARNNLKTIYSVYGLIVNNQSEMKHLYEN